MKIKNLQEKTELMNMFCMRLDGHTYEEIAQKYGTTKQNVWQRLHRVISRERAVKFYPARPALSKYMQEKGLTVTRLAQNAGLSPTPLYLYLEGANPSQKTIMKLSKATDIPESELMQEPSFKEVIN